MKERSLTARRYGTYHRTIEATDLSFISLHEAAALLRARKVSSVELTVTAISRVRALDPELRAFISTSFEAALDAARVADSDLDAGTDRGPLHGIPIALKDLYDEKGAVTTGGSKIFERNVAKSDSAVAARLRAAGAVILGKTNLHEWAFGVTNQNPFFGDAKNPWDRTRIPGGSSGGSAIAVATGMCFMSPGTDTGGSIRIPAALCGIAGIKPTYGRVSLRGVVPLAWSLDHAGPLARTVRDLAIALQVMAGYDAGDPASSVAPVDDYLADLDTGVKGIRVLIPTTHFFTDVDPEVEAAVRAAAKTLASLGADVREGPLPHTELLLETQRTIISTDAAAYHRDHLRDHPDGFGPYVRERMLHAETITGSDLAIARRRRDEIRSSWADLLKTLDVIVTPTTPEAAIARDSGQPAGERDASAARLMTRNTSPFNLTGLPAISIPCGFTSAGLPIGLQLAAGPWRESLLLRVARAYERATEWHVRHPK